MRQYLDLARQILDHGERKDNRTGVGTIGIFGAQIRIPLSEGFPLLTTKKMFFKGVVHELLWFIKGDTNIKYLNDNGVHIWDQWADENGDLGPVYGKQWREWDYFLGFGGKAEPGERTVFSTLGRIDQLKNVAERIKTNPSCRRLIVSAWNPPFIDVMALPPCHCLFQFNVYGGKLHCQLYQRSADLFLGVPFNIASYALLTHMMARHAELPVGDFIHTFGDVHIYENHIAQMTEQVLRDPKPLPKLVLDPGVKSIFDFKYEHIKLEGYESWPAIKGEVAV